MQLHRELPNVPHASSGRWRGRIALLYIRMDLPRTIGVRGALRAVRARAVAAEMGKRTGTESGARSVPLVEPFVRSEAATGYPEREAPAAAHRGG